MNRIGDLWRLGHHRLACGDALDEVNWGRLMAGKKAAMTCSDFPYNVKINGHVSGLGEVRHAEFPMAAGEMDKAGFTAFLRQAFENIVRHSRSGSLHYIFMDWRHLGEMQTAGDAVFSELKNVCVWAKDRPAMGSLYRSQHEMIFVWKSGRERHRNNVELGRNGRNRSNVWEYPGIGGFRHSDEGDLLRLHPTVKPVRMIADAILDVTARGDIVLDPFLGSGTTIIAAERVGRRAYGMELDPVHADTAIRRYEGHNVRTFLQARGKVNQGIRDSQHNWRGFGWWEWHGAALDRRTTHDRDHQDPPPAQDGTRGSARAERRHQCRCCRECPSARRAGDGQAANQGRSCPAFACTRWRRLASRTERGHRLAPAHLPGLPHWPSQAGPTAGKGEAG